MNPQSFPCQLISWDEAYQLSRKLALAIKSSGFCPDLVIAVGRGGYVPARIVCDFLLHSLLTSIKIEHWDIAACKRPEAAVRFPLAVDVRDQSILIIDDVTDTGDTLRAALDYVKALGAGETKTGVMQHKTTSSAVPDFYADVIKDWRWIISSCTQIINISYDINPSEGKIQKGNDEEGDAGSRRISKANEGQSKYTSLSI